MLGKELVPAEFARVSEVVFRWARWCNARQTGNALVIVGCAFVRQFAKLSNYR